MKNFSELLRINAYAEGYYSGQSYSETVYLPVEYREILELADLTLYISDLDGKHSEVKATISIEVATEEELLEDGLEDSDGYQLYEHIQYLDSIDKKELIKDVKEVEKFMSSLDYLVSINLAVKKSQVDTVKEFVKNL